MAKAQIPVDTRHVESVRKIAGMMSGDPVMQMAVIANALIETLEATMGANQQAVDVINGLLGHAMTRWSRRGEGAG